MSPIPAVAYIPTPASGITTRRPRLSVWCTELAWTSRSSSKSWVMPTDCAESAIDPAAP